MIAYRGGRDGLKSNLPDRFWRPEPDPRLPATRRSSGGPDRPARKPARRTSRAGPGAFPPKRTLDGVDTSHYQGGRIDLKAAQAAGLRWWYLKATEGDHVQGRDLPQAREAGPGRRDPGRRLPLRPPGPR